MKINLLQGTLAVGISLIAAACGGSTAGSAPSSGGAPAKTPPAALIKASRVSVSGTPETVLTDGKGLTLYLFMPEKESQIACTGDCTNTWRPLLLPTGVAQPTVDGALPGQLAVVSRPDGTVQATYDEWPLYTFAADRRAGDTGGQGIGGQWFAVQSDAPADADGDNDGTKPPPATPQPVAAPPAPATPAPAPQRPPAPPAFNDGDADNRGGPSDGDGNG
jgi:predicted lipoprotein with Yx(FWY)xxD motif